MVLVKEIDFDLKKSLFEQMIDHPRLKDIRKLGFLFGFGSHKVCIFDLNKIMLTAILFILLEMACLFQVWQFTLSLVPGILIA